MRDCFFGGDEDLDADYAGGSGDVNSVDVDACDFVLGTGTDEEGIFGAVGVVFFVCYLIRTESWCWKSC